MNIKKLKFALGLGLIFAAIVFITHLYIEYKKEKLKSEIVNDIEKIMQFKKVMMDGMIDENVIMKETDVPVDEYSTEYNGIKRYYTLLSGGFSLYVIDNSIPEVYNVYNIVSSDLGYKKDKFNDSGNEYPDFKECYRGSYNYLTTQHPQLINAYVSGSSESIQKIGDLKNRYYKVGKLDENSFGYKSSGHPSVSNYYFNLYYNTSGQKYTIRQVTSGIVWDYILYVGLEIIILAIISFILLYKPSDKNIDKV